MDYISSNLDFPKSEFSDDLFEYLPFNKALRKNAELKKDVKFPVIMNLLGFLANFVKREKLKELGDLIQESSNVLNVMVKDT